MSPWRWRARAQADSSFLREQPLVLRSSDSEHDLKDPSVRTPHLQRVTTHSATEIDKGNCGIYRMLVSSTPGVLRVEHIQCFAEGVDESYEVDESSVQLLDAFSHYTWEASAHSLLILLELDGNSNVVPYIHTAPSPGCGGAQTHSDMGAEAIDVFFKTHVCSEYCRQWQGECARTGCLTWNEVNRRRTVLRERVLACFLC